METQKSSNARKGDDNPVNERLEYYRRRDRKHPANAPLGGIIDFSGPFQVRTITDWIWIIVFVSIITVAIAFSAFFLGKGDINHLTRGYDYLANTCGEGHFTDRPYVYWVNPLVDINMKLCVSSCYARFGEHICIYDNDGKEISGADDPRTATGCEYRVPADLISIYCYPQEPVSRDLVEKFLETPEQLVRSYGGDFVQSEDIIIFGIALGMVSSYVIMKMLHSKRMHMITAVLCLIGSAVTGIVMALLCLRERDTIIDERCEEGQKEEDCEGSLARFYYSAFVILLIIDMLYVITLFVLAKRTRRAIQVLRMSSKAIRSVPRVMFLPFLITAGVAALALLFLYSILSGLSIANFEENKSRFIYVPLTRSIEFDEDFFPALIYMGISFLWILLVAQGLSYFIVSLSMMRWYFDKEKVDRKTGEKSPGYTSWSVKVAFRYHLGSIIFGSTVVFLMWPFKAVSHFLKKRLEQGYHKSRMVKLIINCAGCIIHLHEVYLKYLSINGLAQVAMFGYCFFEGGTEAYYLIRRNFRKLKNISFYQYFLMLQCRITVASFPFYFVYFWLDNQSETITGEDLQYIRSPMFPAFMVFALSLLFSSMLTGVFRTGTDTVLQCLVMEDEMFPDGGYAAHFILDLVNDLNRKKEKQLPKLKSTRKDPRSKKDREEKQMFQNVLPSKAGKGGGIFLGSLSGSKPFTSTPNSTKAHEDENGGIQEYEIIKSDRST